MFLVWTRDTKINLLKFNWKKTQSKVYKYGLM